MPSWVVAWFVGAACVSAGSSSKNTNVNTGGSKLKKAEDTEKDEEELEVAGVGDAGLAWFDSRMALEDELRTRLLRNYNMDVPPATSKGPVTVQVGLNLYKVHSVDLVSSMMSLSVWVRQSWVDPRLAYNDTKYPLPFVTFKQMNIWTPDIDLYNQEEQTSKTLSQKDATVYSDGSIFWSRPGLLKVLCRYRGLETFPFDSLKCTLEIGGWTLDGTIQDIIAREKDCGFTWTGGTGCADQEAGTGGLESGMTFQDYRIVNVALERKIVLYDCCAEQPWPELLFTITLNRASGFYMSKMVVPMVLLAYASFLPFFMSPNTGERLGFAITLVLAMVATDIIAADLMPRCSEKLWMGTLTHACMMFGILALAETAVVLFLYHCEAESLNALLPRCFRAKCFNRLTWGQDLVDTFKEKDIPNSQSSDSLGSRTLSERERLNRLKEARKSVLAEAKENERLQNGDSILPVLGEPSQGVAPNVVQDSPSRNVVKVMPSRSPTGCRSPNPEGFRSPTGCRSPNPDGRMSTTTWNQNEELVSFRVRTQLYRQAFYILDQDFSGNLTLEELNKFGHWMLGNDWNEETAIQFMNEIDQDKSGTISQDEFIDFVEGVIAQRSLGDAKDHSALKYMEPMVLGFISMCERRQKTTVAMWQSYAYKVDKFSRWIFFVSFSLTIVVLTFSYSPEQWSYAS